MISKILTIFIAFILALKNLTFFLLKCCKASKIPRIVKMLDQLKLSTSLVRL